MSYWSAERVDRLHELLTDPIGYSGGAIADQLNRESPHQRITRCAVIGKIHRMHWTALLLQHRPPASASPKPRPRPPAAKPNGGKPPHATPLPPAREDPVPPGQRRQLLALRELSCRWPFGDPRHGVYFCGAPVLEGRPYCLRHCERAYVGWRRG